MDFLIKNSAYLAGFYLLWLLTYVALGFETTLILLAIMAIFILIWKN
jgi:hypothetical protein